MINYYFRSLKDEGIKRIDHQRKGCWIEVVDPSEEEINFLSQELGLDKGHLTDALDVYESPRLEIEGGDVYVFLRVPFSSESMVHTLPVLFVLTENWVVTVVSRQIPLFDDFLSGKINVFTTQKSKFLVQLFLKVNSLFRNFIDIIGKNIWLRQGKIMRISEEDIVSFVQWEEILNDFINSLVPTTAIYKLLLSKQYLKFFKEDKDLIEDLLLSSEEILDICKTKIKAMVNLREAYSTLMTNNLNRAIKFLTAITIVFTVPTIIASLWGMNVKLPFQDHPLAFLFIIGITFVIALLLFKLFSKKDWL
ncbi:MAG: magnesium transporter [Candidatus Parcubacteria bacterium]|nr:magnesium transporter CorA family protein [Patescibacteria group bacterium]BCX15947.1 MAG: magnesium transporter [Candidatus Parcubacteria bacterium]